MHHTDNELRYALRDRFQYRVCHTDRLSSSPLVGWHVVLAATRTARPFTRGEPAVVTQRLSGGRASHS
jgi:hypothetical protein